MLNFCFWEFFCFDQELKLNALLNFVVVVVALLVGPIAGLILIIGNVGVILGLFPLHVAWTFYTIIK